MKKEDLSYNEKGRQKKIKREGKGKKN